MIRHTVLWLHVTDKSPHLLPPRDGAAGFWGFSFQDTLPAPEAAFLVRQRFLAICGMEDPSRYDFKVCRPRSLERIEPVEPKKRWFRDPPKLLDPVTHFIGHTVEEARADPRC